MRLMLFAALGVTALIAGIVFLEGLNPGTISGERDQASLVHALLVLAFIGSGVIVSYRGRLAQALQHALAWAAIIAVLMLGYAYRAPLVNAWTRVKGEIMPSAPLITADGVVTLRRSADGHFWADAAVDGQRVRFLVDTGASSTVLTLDDASRAGIHLADLRFSVPVDTANGLAMAGRARVNAIEIGSITVRDMPVLVSPRGLNSSLLGMSFLNRLNGFSVSRDTMILQP